MTTPILQFGSDLPLPPKHMIFMDADHAAMLVAANNLLDLPRRIGVYTPDTPVWDIGCGYGRLAYAMLRNKHRAPYLGVDILPNHIAWLRDNIKPHLPPGSDFIHLDVANGRYNPAGTIPATQAELPRPAWPPALALLFSVFTHMYPADIAHYVSQLRSALEPGAAACVTFFLLNSESRSLATPGRSAFSFPYRYSDTCSFFDKDDPLHAIGLDEAWVYHLLRENGMQVEHVFYGTWCGRADTGVFQDTMILRRTA